MNPCGPGHADNAYLVVTSIDDRVESFSGLLTAAALAERLGAELLIVDGTRHVGLGAAVGLVPPNIVDEAVRAQRAYVQERVATLLSLTRIRWCLLTTGGSRRAVRRAVAARTAGVVIDMRPRRPWYARRRRESPVSAIPAPSRHTDVTF